MLGKIPCHEDGELTFSDPSVIVAYLEKRQPGAALYPSDAEAFGGALWLEEYADSKCAEIFGPKICFQRVISDKLLEGKVDETALERAIAEHLPPMSEHWERQVPESGDAIVGGHFSNADIAIGSQVVNLGQAGVTRSLSHFVKNLGVVNWAARPS